MCLSTDGYIRTSKEAVPKVDTNEKEERPSKMFGSYCVEI